MSTSWEYFRSGPSGVRVVVAPHGEAAIEAALSPLTDLLLREGSPLVGLATGATFEGLFDALVSREHRLDLARLRLTHLDEYLGWDASQPGSMVRELGAGLLDRLPRPVAAFHPVPATATDHPADALGALLDDIGPIHLQYLGIGRNGHIAFNEPGTSFGLRTHVADLTDETIEANRPRFGDGPIPRRALTLGVAGILEARRLCLVALGEGKAGPVARALEGPIGPSCPASAIRLHPDVLVVLDEPAASGLGDRARWTPERLPDVVLAPDQIWSPGPVVVISPHPDDASISCGGLLASLPTDTPRHIVTMTTGARARVEGAHTPEEVARRREDEVLEEARLLEAEAHFPRCRFYDSGAFERSDVELVAELLRSLRPAWLLAPALDDPHPTHRLTRQVLDEAVRELVDSTGSPVEVWTFEGAWHQHPTPAVNTLVLYDDAAERKKQAAVRAHASQLRRVPFDQGAEALARLRAVTFSESHLGGTEPGNLDTLPHVEAYIRDRVS